MSQEQYAGEMEPETAPEEEAVDEFTDQDEAEYEDESPSEEIESSEESEPEVDLDPQIKALGRDVYGRVGGLQGELKTLKDTVSDLAESIRNQQQMTAEQETAYAQMEPEQKKAVDELFEHHPTIRRLEEKLGGMEESATTGVIEKNKAMFGQAMHDVRSQHGEDIATEIAQDLHEVAELTNWDLSHPVFQKQLAAHHQRLEAAPKKREQDRGEARTERGNGRRTKPTPRTARVKNKDGSVYYDFERAVDIAAEEVSSKRRRR
jgi:hypothetical protein